jgi:LAO/AO transport system kinase
MTLAEQLLSGNRLALTRLLTQVENDTPEGHAALTELFPYTGKAHLIGVTGAPGTGKSSLVNQLALRFRQLDEHRVAVVAVDPSSPFTGGALLGDRVRMRDLSGDPGIFIRSMASRGSLGGLAQTTAGLVQVFDAAGFDMILIETVGAGQAEVEIARLAHTTLVVEAPGMGDDIQAIKAGILEIADIIVVNKADRPGVENTLKALRNALELAHPVQRVFQHHGRLEVVEEGDGSKYNTWIPPVKQTVATDGEGVSELADEIVRHAQHLRESGDWVARERSRLGSELETLLQETLVSRFHEQLPQSRYEQTLEQVFLRELSPREAVKLLLNGRSK